MKKLAFVLMVIFAVACKQEKTNVILFVADDLGWMDTGFMGSTIYETPHIDQLAAEGMVYTQAYAGAANCAPSRACLMSGQNSPRHGIYTVGSSERGHEKTRKLIPVSNITVLDDSFITLAEELHDAGYVTATMGKWHLNEDPRTQGFDINYAGGIWGHPAGYFAPFKYPKIEAEEGEHLTDLITAEAIQFIESHKDDPFFLYLPFYAVHTPIQGKQHLIKHYEAKGGNALQNNATYGAMISTMDSCIGSVLSSLDRHNLRDHTLVIFTSDNGGVYQISRQDPLRGGKGSYYEGGIRVPLVFNWPQQIKPGSVSLSRVNNLDFYPTILDVLGIEARNPLLDGRSLKEELLGQDTVPNKPLFYHFPIYLEANKASALSGRDSLFRTRPGAVIIDGDWKLHWYFEDQGLELYHLGNDLSERVNLAAINPEKRNQLLKQLKDWIAITEAPIPDQINLAYDSIFERERIQKWTLSGK